MAEKLIQYITQLIAALTWWLALGEDGVDGHVVMKNEEQQTIDWSHAISGTLGKVVGGRLIFAGGR
jgi:hypothetical protein